MERERIGEGGSGAPGCGKGKGGSTLSGDVACDEAGGGERQQHGAVGHRRSAPVHAA
jgi:hypothetical protein